MKMNYKLMALETFAIAACYIILAWPLASATNVNILFNGQTQETAELSIGNLLNKQITSKHEPSDVTWTDVKIVAAISSASLSHTIEKIYLYKCKAMSPSSCIMTAMSIRPKPLKPRYAFVSLPELSTPIGLIHWTVFVIVSTQ